MSQAIGAAVVIVLIAVWAASLYADAVRREKSSAPTSKETK